jgi:hypothetical protein
VSVLLPVLRGGVVSGRPIRASSLTGVSDEVAWHHIDNHGCERTGRYGSDHYACEHDGATAEVITCDTCGASLVVIVPVLCEHVPELLHELNVEAST